MGIGGMLLYLFVGNKKLLSPLFFWDGAVSIPVSCEASWR
jgi:hypothetical protein